MEIKVGDVVRVRGIPGPDWVVEGAASEVGAPGGPGLLCLRFGPDGVVWRDVFPASVLEKVEPAGEKGARHEGCTGVYCGPCAIKADPLAPLRAWLARSGIERAEDVARVSYPALLALGAIVCNLAALGASPVRAAQDALEADLAESVATPRDPGA